MSKKSKKKKSKTIITSENIVVNTSTKVCNLFKTKPERSIGWIGEDGYDLIYSDDIKDLGKRKKEKQEGRFLNKGKRVSYKLSRWAREIVRLLEKNGEMKNADIMDELRKRGFSSSASHINKFFKSADGEKFYKEQLSGNNGYWSLSFNKKSKTVSIPIMITNRMRFQLSALGYSKDEMKNLTPEECWDIINKGFPKKPSIDRSRNQ